MEGKRQEALMLAMAQEPINVKAPLSSNDSSHLKSNGAFLVYTYCRQPVNAFLWLPGCLSLPRKHS